MPHAIAVHEDWAFSDVIGLDEDSLKHVPKPCVGAIFLYPFSQCEARKRSLGNSRGSSVPQVWFMKQQLGNACGAVALMHTVRPAVVLSLATMSVTPHPPSSAAVRHRR